MSGNQAPKSVDITQEAMEGGPEVRACVVALRVSHGGSTVARFVPLAATTA